MRVIDTKTISNAEYVPIAPAEYWPIADVPGGVLGAYKQLSDCRCCSATDRKRVHLRQFFIIG